MYNDFIPTTKGIKLTKNPKKLAIEIMNYYVRDQLSEMSETITEFFGDPIPETFDKSAFVEKIVAMFRESIIEDLEYAINPDK